MMGRCRSPPPVPAEPSTRAGAVCAQRSRPQRQQQAQVHHQSACWLVEVDVLEVVEASRWKKTTRAEMLSWEPRV